MVGPTVLLVHTDCGALHQAATHPTPHGMVHHHAGLTIPPADIIQASSGSKTGWTHYLDYSR